MSMEFPGPMPEDFEPSNSAPSEPLIPDEIRYLLDPSQQPLPTAAELEQARRTLQIRGEFLRDHKTYTDRDVTDLGSVGSASRSLSSYALRRNGEIFSVIHHRKVYYPSFQFSAEGDPLPVISEVLPVLRSRFEGPWEVAFWFTSTNAWLDGEAPVDLLLSDPDRVLEAAQSGADRGGF